MNNIEFGLCHVAVLHLKDLGFNAEFSKDRTVYWRTEVKNIDEFVNTIWFHPKNILVEIVRIIPLSDDQGFEIHYYHG